MLRARAEPGMTLPTSTGLLLLATMASPAPQEPSPRVVLRLVIEHASPRLVVENAASRPTVLAGETYLVLTSGQDGPERRDGATRGTDAAPGRHGSVSLSARVKLTAPLRPADLAWAEDRSRLSAELSLGRTVPPGTYRLQVQVQAPSGTSWRSN